MAEAAAREAKKIAEAKAAEERRLAIEAKEAEAKAAEERRAKEAAVAEAEAEEAALRKAAAEEAAKAEAEAKAAKAEAEAKAAKAEAEVKAAGSKGEASIADSLDFSSIDFDAPSWLNEAAVDVGVHPVIFSPPTVAKRQLAASKPIKSAVPSVVLPYVRAEQKEPSLPYSPTAPPAAVAVARVQSDTHAAVEGALHPVPFRPARWLFWPQPSPTT